MASSMQVKRHKSSDINRTGTIVYLVRHGEAEHNVVESASCFQRRRDQTLADPALTKLGAEQAQTAAATIAKHMADHQDDQPCAVISSTLRRALQTAEITALPLCAPQPKLLALEAACEIQFWDIWNEARSSKSVAADWPNWMIESCNVGLDCGTPPLETASQMVKRAEAVWKRIAELQLPIVILVAHGCFLSFFSRRVNLASNDSDPIDVSHFQNAEVRRIRLPSPDGRSLQYEELVQELAIANKGLDQSSVGFWIRFSKRVKAIRSAGLEDVPPWAQKEWRYAQEDQDFDAKL